ncbi:MAG: ketopantoate reductase family protein [Solirubrobacteraceae bacterium]
MSSVAILGPGGVGGFVAALLARAGEGVTVIARPQTAQLIERQGLSVETERLGRFTVRLNASTELPAPVNFLLIATKATTLVDALERIGAQPQVVVPLLNGFDHMEILRDRFGAAHVAAGTIRIETDRPEPGRVVQTGGSVRVELAADNPVLRPALAELQGVLERAQIPTKVGPSEGHILWSKLVRLAPLALTTSAAVRPIGFIRSDAHWREMLEAAIRETTAVANADGARIDPEDPLDELDAAHSTLSSSMQRDLAAGRPPELAIPRAVLQAASRHGLECPTIEQLTEQVAQRAAARA